MRLYDVETWQCYASPSAQDNHTAPVTKVSSVSSRPQLLHSPLPPPPTQVQYSPDGSAYASTCRAGSVKLWDTVSSRCVYSFDSLHGGAAGVSVQVSG